jgi:hypothetical protein
MQLMRSEDTFQFVDDTNRVGPKTLQQKPYYRSARLQRERVSIVSFSLSPFSLSDKIEDCSAQFLAVAWIVHVDFKIHRLRDSSCVSNPLLLS